MAKVPDAAANSSYWSKWSFNARLVANLQCDLPGPAHRGNHERPLQSVKHTGSLP